MVDPILGEGFSNPFGVINVAVIDGLLVGLARVGKVNQTLNSLWITCKDHLIEKAANLLNLP